MLQTLQKFFVENNRELLIKYDGERKKNMFTVMLSEDVEGELLRASYGNDTDDIVRELNSIFENWNTIDKSKFSQYFENLFENIWSKLPSLQRDSYVVGLRYRWDKEPEATITLFIIEGKKSYRLDDINITSLNKTNEVIPW